MKTTRVKLLFISLFFSAATPFMLFSAEGLKSSTVQFCFKATLLAIAIEKGNVEEVKKLLDGNANPNACRYMQYSDNKVQLDDKESDALSVLVYASGLDCSKIVKLLIEARANTNGPSGTSSSVLNAAVEEGHLAVIKLLIDNNASVDLKDDNDDTPLSIAEKGDPKVRELLRAANKNQNVYEEVD